MDCPHWLLALTIPFSRSDRARTCPQALVPGGPKDCSGRIAPLESFLRLPEGLGRPLGGTETLPDGRRTVNAPNKVKGRRTESPGPAPSPSYRGLCPPSRMGSDGLERPLGARTGIRLGGTASPVPGCPVEVSPAHRSVACGEPPGPPHATRCPKPNGLSAPSPRHRAFWERAPPADLFDLPHLCELLCPSLNPGCCTGMTKL
jgi:hypothetical protein